MLEQYLPQGPDHPFAHTMLAHFKKLQASIYAIEKYLTLEQQSSRFLGSGWTGLNICRNLWDLWSDDTFTPPWLRRKLDTIEPFDEWEEFALFGSHYFLLEASNMKLNGSTETSGLNSSTKAHGSVTDTSEKVDLCHQADDFSTLTPRRGHSCNLRRSRATRPTLQCGCAETGG
jgi:tRNA wybutosine-synthesizing protein 4